ncbi:transglycosylase domain-containing protein [Corticicoccus populi]|uniref:Transglycosylase domain-containing protein n=1 Tax=Corticicoccus populi TaxID=1812821 RepID=A0ABW5WTJ6_9STAP
MENYKRSKKPAPSKKKENNEKNNGSRKKLIKHILLYVVMIGLIGLVLGAILFAYYASQAPAFSEEKLKDPVPARIFDQNDELITTIHQGQKREFVSIEDIPEQMTDAVLAVEDNRFYSHGAMDFIGLGRAVLNNITDGFGSGGASTITQQVVKRVFLTEEQTLERKAQEAYLAYRLEQEYSKDEILEMYLNKIYYSDGIYGVRTASIYYFGKELADLNLAEAAYLAGLPQLPNRYNLYVDPEHGTDRAHIVLRLMLEHERITQEEYDEAVNTDITANLVERSEEDRASNDPEDPEYAAYIDVMKRELGQNDNFGNMDVSEILSSGVDIYTNMDADIQTNLQNLTDNRDYYYNPKFQHDDFDIASTILDTETGALVAISGGRDYQEVVMHNQSLTQKNTGSSIKPFTAYGPAIENFEWRTDQTIQDAYEYTPEGTNNTIYNYDMQNHGNVTIREALSRSYNVPAVKAFEEVSDEFGADVPKEFAEGAGLNYSAKDGGEDYQLTFNDVLGGGDYSLFSPLQMAEAYATLGNGGEHNTAQSIRQVVTSDGDTIEFENDSEQVMEDSTAFMLTDILKDTFRTNGSADYIQMDGLNIAGKTGTTSYSRETREQYNLPDNAAKDAWIIGYTPEYTMSVWTGFTSTQENGETSLVGTDEHITPQWFFRDIMQTISSYNGQDFEQPDSVVALNNGEFAVAGSEDMQNISNSGGRSQNNQNQNNQNNQGGNESSNDGNRNTWWYRTDEDGNVTESSEDSEEQPSPEEEVPVTEEDPEAAEEETPADGESDNGTSTEQEEQNNTTEPDNSEGSDTNTDDGTEETTEEDDAA